VLEKWKEKAEPVGLATRDAIRQTSPASKVKMANVGIEPKTFALLARRSNQLS
jgi:hypothetical protein